MSYILPPATSTQLGGVKVGKNLTIDEDGTLNASGIDELNSTLTTCLNDIETGKTKLAESITNKGVPTHSTDSFSTMSNNIDSIPSEGTPGCITGTNTASTDVFHSNLVTEVTHNV